ncbi:MAG: PAS domain S-box protein, partial [Candidatus Thermoplasmatota archaeon]|nr:PAS domain S-box protein [Candidatus Thermoplasmatota archaeon]
MSDERQTREDSRIKELALESSLNPIALSDLDGDITYVNPAFIHTWGYDDIDEVLGRPATAFLATEGKAKEVLHALHERGKWFGDLIAQRNDGTTFPVQTAASMVTNEDGEAVGMTASFVDLSEHARIRQALHETERKFRAIINNSPIGIALLDEDGGLLLSNPALQDMLGYSEEQLDGLGLSDVTHPEDLEKDEALFQELHNEERTSYSIDKRFVRRDGSSLWGALTVAVIRDEENEPQYVICMVEDITFP